MKSEKLSFKEYIAEEYRKSKAKKLQPPKSITFKPQQEDDEIVVTCCFFSRRKVEDSKQPLLKWETLKVKK